MKDDVYSSIHIQELELHVRDTKRGQEEITREIPNVAEERLIDLDERGIIRIGAHVKPGDILVGKITPKGETELSPEEKLLTAIFGEKAKDVKDSSLKVPPGMEGVVIDVKIFSRIDDQVIEKDRGERIGEVRRLENDEKMRVSEVRDSELAEMFEGQMVTLALKSGTVEEAITAGTKLTPDLLRDLKIAALDLKTFRVENKKMNERIREVIEAANDEKARIEEKAEERIDKILQPDELPPGVIQLVKVYLAEKRKISVGDKMAGRHGNKGIVARIVPEEDMPFLPDGRPVDIVLNPLGVPSRMNVGQILETHLGWCAQAAWLLRQDAGVPGRERARDRNADASRGAQVGRAGAGAECGAAEHHGCGHQDDHARHQAGARGRGAREPRRRDGERSGRTHDVAGDARHLLPLPRFPHGGREGAGRSRACGSRSADHAARCTRRGRRVPGGAQARAARTRSSSSRRAAVARARMCCSRTSCPALAAMLGPKSELDVDAAAVELMRLAGLTLAGKVWLRDGRTGERFANPVTVGEIYMLKLSHFVDDKIHARSIGPYSLVTQQPLAGKAQFGGQRFGEMEVWALEAYGAAHTLQEILTVKSDDVNGRSRVYEAIVKGQNLPEPGIPESFNVLVKELQALGIWVHLGATGENGHGNGNGNGED